MTHELHERKGFTPLASNPHDPGRLAVYDTGEREARFMADFRQHIHGIGGKAASKQQAVNKRTTNNKQEH